MYHISSKASIYFVVFTEQNQYFHIENYYWITSNFYYFYENLVYFYLRVFTIFRYSMAWGLCKSKMSHCSLSNYSSNRHEESWTSNLFFWKTKIKTITVSNPKSCQEPMNISYLLILCDSIMTLLFSIHNLPILYFRFTNAN